MKVLLVVVLLLFVSCSSAPKRDDSSIRENTRSSASGADKEAQDSNADPDAIEPIEEQDVEFTSGGAKLLGTIVSPAGDTRARQGVVITHDYGPLGRDGVIAETFAVALPVEVPVYRAIADHLASRGFAVLIYDKRTCVTGSAPGCTYPRSHIDGADNLGELLVTDALAAASFLEAREDVADGPIHFVGHGQGAEVATVASARRNGDGRVVMLAPSANALDEIVLWQSQHSARLLEQRIEAVGDTPEADLLKKQLDGVRTLLAQQTEAFARLRGGADANGGGEVLGLSPQTWRSYFDLHTSYLETLRQAKVSSLAIIADADLNYPSESAQRMETVMRAQGEEQFVLVTEVTHPMVGIGAQDDPTVVSPIVLNLLTSYLTSGRTSD